MIELLVDWLKAVPPEAATLILAMMPVGELRGSLPTALTVYDMPVWKAFILSVAGNMIPVYFLLILFEHGSDWLRKKSSLADRLLAKLYARTRLKLHDKIDKYGVWALALFVAVPLPVTGAWTGTLAAFVFGLSRRKSFIAIFVGLLISAAIVTLISLGVTATVNAFLVK